MIGLILGTSEGKTILSLLNEFTDDIFVSTATAYGGELLEGYKYKILNEKPLDLNGFVETFKKNKISLLLDATHPYAVEVTQNAALACKTANVEYVRYERPSVLEDYRGKDNIFEVGGFDELRDKIKCIEGNVFNTTGSKNVQNIMDMKLENRIIHRVLPTPKSIEKCIKAGVNIKDIIAMEGPASFDLNCSLIREYNIKSMILKDSGVEGGTKEKLDAALNEGICAFVFKRKRQKYDLVFHTPQNAVEYIKKKIQKCN